MSSLSIHPLIQLKTHHQFRAKKTRKSIAIHASSDNPQNQRQQQQQLNLSVLRFTFGGGKKIKNLSFWFFFIMYSDFISWVIWQEFFFFSRDTWTGWILLTKMDWIWVWFPFDIESFSGV